MSNKITLLPEYIDVIQEPSVSFYKTATNLMESYNTYTGELSVAIDFEKSKISNNVIESTSKLYDTLNSTNFKIVSNNTTYEFDNIFKLFCKKYFIYLARLRRVALLAL